MRENAMTEVEAMAKEINARNAATKAIRRALPHLEPGYELVVQRDESGMLVVGRRPIAALAGNGAPENLAPDPDDASSVGVALSTLRPARWKCPNCGPRHRYQVTHESHSQILCCRRCNHDVTPA